MLCRRDVKILERVMLLRFSFKHDKFDHCESKILFVVMSAAPSFSFYLKLGKYRVSTKHVRLIVVGKKSFSQKFDKCSELMRTSVILPLY